MKNILLIGDSILVGSNQTSGYGTIVRDMLKDKANVYIPLDNARYTMYTLHWSRQNYISTVISERNGSVRRQTFY